jgi:hypothetical protein
VNNEACKGRGRCIGNEDGGQVVGNGGGCLLGPRDGDATGEGAKVDARASKDVSQMSMVEAEVEVEIGLLATRPGDRQQGMITWPCFF